MNKTVARNSAKAQLIKQLIYFDQSLTSLMANAYPDDHPLKAYAERALFDYIAAIEVFASTSNNEERLQSTVLIGSRIELLYVESGQVETMTLVFPEQANEAEKKQSFLSSVGFQLLLAKTNQPYRLQLPSGDQTVIVQKSSFNLD